MVGTIVLLSLACVILAGIAISKHLENKMIQSVAVEYKKQADDNFKEKLADAEKHRLALNEAKEESGMLKKKLIEQSESMQVLQKLIQQKA